MSPDEKLLPAYTYFVRVCGFTFRFGSVAQIPSVLEYYSQKIRQSSRLAPSDWLKAEHDVAQRWFERLPAYLLEEPKRLLVVKALQKAVKEFDADLCRLPTQDILGPNL